MTTLLIRHGEVERLYNQQEQLIVYGPDAALSELGRNQLRDLAEKFQQENIRLDAIYTSPYLRAYQSAEILAKQLAIPDVQIIDDLKDVFPCSAEGQPFADLAKIGADIYAHPFSDQQETLEHLVHRAAATTKLIINNAAKRQNSAIGIVSHGDTLSALSWALKYSDLPDSYKAMKEAFYLQKGNACQCNINADFKLEGTEKIISVESSKLSPEPFRE